MTSKQGRHWSREGERGDLIGPRYAKSTVVSLKDVIAETHSLVSLPQWILNFQCFFLKRRTVVCVNFLVGKKCYVYCAGVHLGITPIGLGYVTVRYLFPAQKEGQNRSLNI